MELSAKFNALISKVSGMESVIVAFSGGVDSSVVTAAAKIALGEKAVAVTSNSLTLSNSELDNAERVAEAIGIKHHIIHTDELRNLKFAENPVNRCYYCKKELISKLKKVQIQEGFRAIVDGTNAEDLNTHRPGFLALKEEGVYSPLADVGLTKTEVRALAKMLCLPVAEKPSTACLASRIPYGEKITAERLLRVAEAEKFIKETVGLSQLRVRDHGTIARIEVDVNELRLLLDPKLFEVISKRLHTLGFVYITVDLEGYRSGSMNEATDRKYKIETSM